MCSVVELIASALLLVSSPGTVWVCMLGDPHRRGITEAP